MADEKPTPAAAPEAPPPAAVDPTPAPEAEVTTGPKPGKVRVVSFVARENGRRSAEPAKGDAPAAAAAEAAKTETPAAAPEPPDKSRRALTIALEKEAQLVEDRKAFSDERKAWEAQAAVRAADIKLVEDIRAAVKGGQRLKALELLGIDLDAVQDEFLANVREPTQEEIIDRKVRETLEARQQREADDAAERERVASEARTAEFNQQIASWKDTAEKLYAAKADAFDPAAFDGITADQIWERANKAFDESGHTKLPTPEETLALIQADFDKRMAKSKKFKPADAPATATEDKPTESKARDTTPRTVTSRGAGEVPISAKPAKTRKLTAFERLEEAKREHGVT